MPSSARRRQRSRLRLQLVLLLLGVVLSGTGLVLVQRRIIRPMHRMTATMRHLAEGDLQIAIAGQDRRDEIGDMASALVVFRDGLVEAGRSGGRARVRA